MQSKLLLLQQRNFETLIIFISTLFGYIYVFNLALNMTPAELNENEYGTYYKKYIDLVDSQDLTDAMEYGSTQTVKLVNNIPPSKYDYSYADGKWTVKESLLHVIDTERIFAYRALRFCKRRLHGITRL